MATPKKAVTKKASTKKAVVAKETTAVATDKLKVVTGPIQFNKKEAQNIKMIGQNQDRILKAAGNIIDIAADTGTRLLALKDVVKKHGGKWKAWCKEEGNLPFSYEQANRYSKLAANPAELQLVKIDGVTSIEEAVMAIEHLKKPEKVAEAENKKVAKAAAAKVTPKVVWSLPAVVDVLTTLDLDDLRELQGFIADRIEELEQAEVDAGDDADEDEAADDAVEAESEALAELS